MRHVLLGEKVECCLLTKHRNNLSCAVVFIQRHGVDGHAGLPEHAHRLAECLHLGGIGVPACHVEAGVDVDDPEDVQEVVALFGGLGAVVPGDGQGVSRAVSGVVTGDALVLQEQDEEVMEDDAYLGIGVESLDVLVADLEAEQGFEEDEELFDVPVAFVHQSGEQKEHGPFCHIKVLWASGAWVYELDHAGGLVHVPGEVTEALFDPFAFLFPCRERVGGVFLLETFLFDLIEHGDEVLCHPRRDSHRWEYRA